MKRKSFTPHGGGGASPARIRSTPPSPPRLATSYLYDKPYEDRSKVRVAGPFTVESISPHRVLGVDENGDVIDGLAEGRAGFGVYDFGQIMLENLRTSGVQQAHRDDRIEFTSLKPVARSARVRRGRLHRGR